MPTEQTLFFTCPHCDERFAQVEEPERYPQKVCKQSGGVPSV